MGVFMASAAFRRTEKTDWAALKPQIEALFQGIGGLTHNLESEGPGYAVVSPFGDLGPAQSALTAKLSALTGDYAVLTHCCDSDFALLELYRSGELVEKSYVGECFEDYEEFGDYDQPDTANWLPLLTDASRAPELEEALGEVDIFAEDNLRLLSELTGLPIFDDELVFGME